MAAGGGRTAAMRDRGVVPPPVREVLRRAGEPLEPSVRRSFEERFRFDFGRVRVHSGPAAAASARAISAVAYAARGGHVVLGADAPDRATAAGRWLLGHELAHVVQQSRLDADPAAVEAGGRHEAEAESPPPRP
jgi:hypothetical protein